MRKLISVLVLVFFLVSCGPDVTPTPTPTPTPTLTPTSAGATPSDEAKYHIGERATVYGLVASTNYASASRGRPTFLNLGKPYPNQEFTVLIWGQYRDNFPSSPETYYKGKTIYVTGLITEYKGIPQIEVKTPDQIQEQ